MKEWYGLRSELYVLRKEYLLSKLLKEYETLRNKARFIKAVIEEEVQIKRVKRKVIASQLKSQNYSTQSELDKLLKEKERVTVVRNEEEKDDDEVDLNQEQEEAVLEGEVHPKEYDYLLTMPLWSLSQEKVEELTIAMEAKKLEHDNLAATHFHQLWKSDLDALLVAIGKQEEEDEKDRLAHKAMGTQAKKGGRGKAAKAPAKPKA